MLAVTLVALVAVLVLRGGTTGGEIEASDAATPAETAVRPAGNDAASTDDRGEPSARRPARKRPAGATKLPATVANGLRCRPAPGRPALVRRRAGGTSKRIALTFDDGPTPKYTRPVLDILRKHDVPATFFVIGSQVGPHRDLVRRMVRDGHALANHTWSHANVSGGGALADVQIGDTQYAIQKAVGAAPCLMRPPGGAVGPGLVRWLEKHRKVGVMWDVDSNDYQLPTAAAMTRRIVASTRAGSIILLHDGGGDRSRTVAAVPGIITRLKAKGYEFVTVPELLKLPRAKG